MAQTNDNNFIAFCNELREYVKEHHHFPNKHTKLLNKVKYVRRKIKNGTLEEWKVQIFEDIAQQRTNEHTGGRRKEQPTSE